MSPLQINNIDDTDNQKEKKNKPSAVELTSAEAETIKWVVELDQKK